MTSATPTAQREDDGAAWPWLSRLVGQLSARLDRLEQAVTKLSKETKPEPAKVSAQPAIAKAVDFAKTADATLKGERVDREWDARFRERVTNALSAPELAGTKLRTIECGETLCRMAVDLPSNVQPSSLAQAIASQAKHGGIWLSIDPTVTPAGTALLYIASETSLLPAAQVASAAP